MKAEGIDAAKESLDGEKSRLFAFVLGKAVAEAVITALDTRK